MLIDVQLPDNYYIEAISRVGWGQWNRSINGTANRFVKEQEKVGGTEI